MLNKYAGKHCEKCGTDKDITRDHIIPRWLVKGLSFFLLDVYIVNNDQYLCKTHNLEKGAILDYKDERVRRFLRRFCVMITQKLDEFERQTRRERAQATMETMRLNDIEFGKGEKPAGNVFKIENETEVEKNIGKDKVREKRKNKELDGIKF